MPRQRGRGIRKTSGGAEGRGGGSREDFEICVTSSGEIHKLTRGILRGKGSEYIAYSRPHLFHVGGKGLLGKRGILVNINVKDGILAATEWLCTVFH